MLPIGDHVPLPDLPATQALGRRIADALKPGDVVCLEGPLGAGKTSLARFIIAALGYEAEVPSPTFTLIETYDPPSLRLAVVHADFYRLHQPSEVEELGLDDLRNDAVLLAEWPEKAGGFQHEKGYLGIKMSISGEGRMAELRRGLLWQDRPL